MNEFCTPIQPPKANGNSRIRRVDLLKLALGSIGSNRLRTSLTILGVAIGVFSVVGVMTALSAVRKSIEDGLSFLGAGVFQIQREPALQFGGGPAEWHRRPRIQPRQAEHFKDLMEAEAIPVALVSYAGGNRIRYGEQSSGANITLVGSNEHYLSTNGYNLAYGRNLSNADIEFNRPVVVIGYELEQALFANEEPIGKSILISGGRYEVVGVLEKRGSIFGQNLDNLVIIPIPRFVMTHWNHWRSMELSVQSPNLSKIENTRETAIGKMRQARGLEPEQPNDFELISNDSLQEAFGKIALVVGTGGLLISGIALLCSGVGIMNIMLVSVTERTREIGVRKSLGARKQDILTQFLLEAVFLSELGAGAGIFAGILAGNAIAKTMRVQMIIPWNWMLVAVAICSLIGIGFGLYPAWRAASLKPVDALRYE
jgi:putative ABC transport system permease protein